MLQCWVKGLNPNGVTCGVLLARLREQRVYSAYHTLRTAQIQILEILLFFAYTGYSLVNLYLITPEPHVHWMQKLCYYGIFAQTATATSFTETQNFQDLSYQRNRIKRTCSLKQNVIHVSTCYNRYKNLTTATNITTALRTCLDQHLPFKIVSVLYVIISTTSITSSLD